MQEQSIIKNNTEHNVIYDKNMLRYMNNIPHIRKSVKTQTKLQKQAEQDIKTHLAELKANIKDLLN